MRPSKLLKPKPPRPKQKLPNPKRKLMISKPRKPRNRHNLPRKKRTIHQLLMLISKLNQPWTLRPTPDSSYLLKPLRSQEMPARFKNSLPWRKLLRKLPKKLIIKELLWREETVNLSLIALNNKLSLNSRRSKPLNNRNY